MSRFTGCKSRGCFSIKWPEGDYEAIFRQDEPPKETPEKQRERGRREGNRRPKG